MNRPERHPGAGARPAPGPVSASAAQSTADRFAHKAREALRDDTLQQALGQVQEGFVGARRRVIALTPEFELWREQARDARDRALAEPAVLLERFERAATEAGTQVHWARDAAEACARVLDICREAGARRIAKGKSMATEEIGLNQALAQADMEVVETDLGEYILQLAGEPPSHIIAPAIHKTRAQVAELFRGHHADPPAGPAPDRQSVTGLVGEARQVLRQRFLAAEVGITGANFLVAETGSTVLVTNEGNGDLSASLPPVHIVVAGIEKVVPALTDLSPLLRVLARSGTGQAMTAYTTVFTGPRRSGDSDGPEAMHVVLVDNGRSALMKSELREMLRCIRCGACLNHCPVYGVVGGHAYGWVNSGPMGAVLTPGMLGVEHAYDLPQACTLNGRCETVCPVKIPLPSLLRRLRERQYALGLGPRRARWALRLWGWCARRPRLYRWLAAAGARALSGRSPLGALAAPLLRPWTGQREVPPSQGESFTRMLARARRTERPE